jgi:hypothetical protein
MRAVAVELVMWQEFRYETVFLRMRWTMGWKEVRSMAEKLAVVWCVKWPCELCSWGNVH